jgi:rhodanese-related sulfurtransferase
MAQRIRKGYKALVAEAEAAIETLSVGAAMALHGNPDVVFIDLRDIRELQRVGRIPGAHHCPRGMLEFWIDPDSPYHREIFAQEKKFVFFCAAGWRSALAAKTAADMGLQPVAHIAEGFDGWKETGGPVDLPEEPGAEPPQEPDRDS